MEINEIVNYLKRVESMAKTGLTYSENAYDLERYEELKNSTHLLLEKISNLDQMSIHAHFNLLDPYPTPKVDVRGLVIRENKVLLIQEKVDNLWALPGGWCDIGYSPRENVEKEVFEESGLTVEATSLLSVWDKKFHNHPEEIEYVYKLNFLCKIVSGEVQHGHEALDAGYFDIKALPSLSLPRNTEAQILKLYDLATEKNIQTQFD